MLHAHLRMQALAVALLLSACAGPDAAGPGAYPEFPPLEGSELHGVFEGRVPCADCERTKVRLTLHRSVEDGAPTAYQLGWVNVDKGDDRTIVEGQWQRTVGTANDADAVVYRLDAHAPPEMSTFLAVDDNLLLFLDANLRPRVGNASHAFTLSRTR